MKSNLKTVYYTRALIFMIVFLCTITSTSAQNNCPSDLATNSVKFPSGSPNLTNTAKAQLHNVAEKLKPKYECIIMIVAYPAPSKASQALAEKRLLKMKIYLVEIEGISADRIIVNYELGGGDPNIVKFIPQ